MTLDDLKIYLRIDDDSEDNYLNEIIQGSQIYIDSMVGSDYKSDANAVNLAGILQKKLCADLYESRGTMIEDNKKKDIIISSILDKLSTYEVISNE
ncbi:head-tail connector protein [Clostridium sp.]|uniref:head-tail connector protein n=1 Tax=Clostridium sp. TaxID=1506 RepID=UPI00260626E0|nr:head-tail connector protein [Clostridium sp.]